MSYCHLCSNNKKCEHNLTAQKQYLKNFDELCDRRINVVNQIVLTK